MAKAKAKPGPAKEEAPPGISKFAALTEAIKQRGVNAKNEELVDYIRSKYGEAALPSNLSVTKSAVMKKLREQQAPAQEPAPTKQEPPMVPATPTGIDLDDLQQLKDLAERYGKDQVSKALDLVS